jgi:formylmethanofuran dehydrogenase subunit E
VGVAIPFEDIPPDEKIEFLAKAHRYGVNQTGSDLDQEMAEISPQWLCLDCGGHFTIEDVWVTEGEPTCQACQVSGWEVVHPFPTPS